MRRQLLLLFSACAILFSAHSLAQEKSFGPYQVYYSVLNSSFISPETASAYNIVRGKDRALINIAIRKQLKNGEDIEQAAKLSGSRSDLIHSLPLEFKEIREQGAIYYIADFKFNDKELLAFTIKIQPDPDIAPYTLKFSHTLYEDE